MQAKIYYQFTFDGGILELVEKFEMTEQNIGIQYHVQLVLQKQDSSRTERDVTISQTGPLCWSLVEYHTTPEVENTSYLCECVCVFVYFHVGLNLK